MNFSFLPSNQTVSSAPLFSNPLRLHLRGLVFVVVASLAVGFHLLHPFFGTSRDPQFLYNWSLHNLSSRKGTSCSKTTSQTGRSPSPQNSRFASFGHMIPKHAMCGILQDNQQPRVLVTAPSKSFNSCSQHVFSLVPINTVQTLKILRSHPRP